MSLADSIATSFIVTGLIGAAVLVHCFWINPRTTRDRQTGLLRHPVVHAIIGAFAATLLYVPVPTARPCFGEVTYHLVFTQDNVCIYTLAAEWLLIMVIGAVALLARR
jgi:hypothetical protein